MKRSDVLFVSEDNKNEFIEFIEALIESKESFYTGMDCEWIIDPLQ